MVSPTSGLNEQDLIALDSLERYEAEQKRLAKARKRQAEVWREEEFGDKPEAEPPI